MLSFAVTFAVPLLLVRRLSRYDYGVYKQVFLLIATITGYGQFSFPMSSYYFFPRHENHRAVVMNVMVFIGGIGLLNSAVFGLYPEMARKITGSAETVPLAGLIGWTVCFTILGYFLEVLTVLRQEVRVAGLVVLGSAISKGLLLVSAAWAFSTVEALLWAYMLQGMLQTVFLLAYLHSRYRGFVWQFDKSLFVRQLAYSLPYAVAGFIMATLTDLHSYAVSKRFGASEFAVYAVGCLQLPLTAILTEATGPLLIRQVNVLEQEGRREEIARLILAAGRKLAFVFFPLAGCLIVVGREFLTLLFTEQYLSSYPVFVLNLLLIPLGSLLLEPISRAYPERQVSMLKIRLGLVGLLVLLLYPAMSWLGPIGAMMVVVVVALLERIVLARFWLGILGWPKIDSRLLADTGKLALSAVLAGIAAELFRQSLGEVKPLLVLCCCSAVYGIVYCAVCFGLGILTSEEKGMIQAGIERGLKRVKQS